MESICKKVAFADEEKALYYIEKLKKTSKRFVVPHRTYLCEKCFAWHLSSRPSKEDERAKKENQENQQIIELQNLKKENQKLKERVIQLTKESENRKKKIDELHEKIYECNKLSGRFKRPEDLPPKKD